MRRKILIFGIGYVGLRLAQKLKSEGWEVCGTCRDEQKKIELEKLGFDVALFDGMNKIEGWDFFTQDVTHAVQTIAPYHETDPVLVHKDDLKKLNLSWLGYLSTTGVYGDYDGAWVDENSEARTVSSRGLARLAAENAWLATTLPVHVFRLGGIYGPGRNPIENYSQSIDKPGLTFSRIHVDDIVTILLASINQPSAGQIYNVVDDLPTPPFEPIEFAAQIVGRETPARIPFDQAELSPGVKEFYENNKRVGNDKIKTMLGVKLAYPTYREGLLAIAKNLGIS